MKIDCAVDSGRCERKRLLKILFLKIWVIFEQFQPVRICRQDFQHAPDGDPHPADAGLTAHLAGLDCDPVEWRIEIHTTIMTHAAPVICMNERELCQGLRAHQGKITERV